MLRMNEWMNDYRAKFLNRLFNDLSIIWERTWWGGAEREGERETQADFPLNVEPSAGLDLMTLRSWPEWKSRVRCLTDWATHAPLYWIFFFKADIFCTNWQTFWLGFSVDLHLNKMQQWFRSLTLIIIDHQLYTRIVLNMGDIMVNQTYVVPNLTELSFWYRRQVIKWTNK